MVQKKSDVVQHHVAFKSFPGKNLFAVSAKVEKINSANERPVCVDVIFLEFTEDFASGGMTKKVMKVTSHDLRSMSYGLRELIKNGKSQYRKFTDPNLAGRNGSKNELNLGIEQKDGKPASYYINLVTGGKKIGCGFDAYALAALSDALLLIAEESDKALFYHQRSLY